MQELFKIPKSPRPYRYFSLEDLNGRFLFPDMGADDTIEIPPFVIPLL